MASHSPQGSKRAEQSRRPSAPTVKPPAATTISADTLQQAVENPDNACPADMVQLQKRYGNQAVQGLLTRSGGQAKLTVGPAGDTYEQEADRVADQVMMMPAQTATRPGSAVQRQAEEEEVQTKPLANTITPRVQRQEDEEEEVQTKPLANTITPRVQRQEDEEEEVQTKPLAGTLTPRLQRQEDEEELQTKRQDPRAGFEAGTTVEAQLQEQRGRGSPLPAEVRAFMEPRFGADFGGVHVHTDSGAAQLNRQWNAQAFTHQQDIYVGEGRYSPGSDAGRRLLAHELTHVVQQTGHIQPRIQRWSVGGHGKITAFSVDQFNREMFRTGQKDKMIGADELKQITEGAGWNDLLGHNKVAFLFAFLKKGTLTHESHEGELQFLHSMAATATESVWKTQHKIITWAKFCYYVASGRIAPTTQLKDVDSQMTPPRTEFEGGAGVTISSLFGKWGDKTISWLFSSDFRPNKTDPAKIRNIATGSMLHMLQDSFCVSHAQRVAGKGTGEAFRKLRAFNVYGAQDNAPLISRHAMADNLHNAEATQTAGAIEAANTGVQVLIYLKTGADWDTVVEPYFKKIYELEAESKPKDAQGKREAMPGVSVSDRRIRKKFLDAKFKSDSSRVFHRRPDMFKMLDKQLESYTMMVKVDVENMTRHQTPQAKKAQLEMEKAMLDAVVKFVTVQLGQIPDGDFKKTALQTLLADVLEDLHEIESDLAGVNRALR